VILYYFLFCTAHSSDQAASRSKYAFAPNTSARFPQA
jgi:hypothetical protein